MRKQYEIGEFASDAETGKTLFYKHSKLSVAQYFKTLQSQHITGENMEIAGYKDVTEEMKYL